MSAAILITLIRKDIRLFFANRFFALVTVLGLVFYSLVYHMMPRTVDERMEIGLLADRLPEAFSEQLADEGMLIEQYTTEAALREAVASGGMPVGIIFPADLASRLAVGHKPQAQILLSADIPVELRDIYALVVEEWVATIVGQPLNLAVTEEVLGVELAGGQVAPRDRMLPLFAAFILMLETLGLASLITAEIAGGTIRALLVTPLRTEGLFLGKGLTGVGLAFSETAILMTLTGGLRQETLLVLAVLLLGAILVTGIAFLLASAARDLMSVMAWGILLMLLLVIPALNILIPGLASSWIRALPSYYLVESLHQIINYGHSWAEVSGHLLALAAYAAAILATGVVVLRRRFR
jgi:ABC-2 type transport system permease protein